MSLAAVIAASEQERESWRWTSLQALRATDFAEASHEDAAAARVDVAALPALLPESDRHRLVFVDGVLRRDLAELRDWPDDLIAGDAEAGYRLTIGGQTCLATAPLELVCVARKAPAARQSRLRLRLDLGGNARLTLIEHQINSGVGAAHVALTEMDITLREQAKLLHATFQRYDAADYHLGAIRTEVAAGAFYEHFAFTTGAALSRREISVKLAGVQAQTRLSGIYLLRGGQHADTTTLIDHAAPHGTSREIYHGVIDGQARGVFQGRILVRPGAQKTDAGQLSRAMLLSEQAEADGKPELEIYADDVKCSHGATVGRFDDDARFYLRSRGIPDDEARALLIAGFAGTVIAEIPMPELRDWAADLAQGWLRKEGA